MPNRPCLEPRCPSPATYRGRCQRHARQRDKQIARAGKSIYNTKRWQLTRKRKLFLTPLCEYVDPDEGPCMAVATDVHHKQDIAEGGDPWDMGNLEALCHSHHSMVTRARQRAA